MRRGHIARSGLAVVCFTLFASVVSASALLQCASADDPAPTAGIEMGAAGSAPAVRVEPPPGRPPPAAHTAVVIGDSLSDLGREQLETALLRPDWDIVYDAKSGRSIISDDDALSGVLAVESIQAQGIQPDVWIIELGTNDVDAIDACNCPNRVTASLARIRQMLTAIGRGQRVEWVNVVNYDRPETTLAYNQALDALVKSREIVAVTNWYAPAHDHQEDWFSDAKHLTAPGYLYWAALIAATFTTH
jgi:lysophospholipase L1-like esterase